jgi:cardiolipin synthase
MPILSGRAAVIVHALTALRALSGPLLWWLIVSLQLEAASMCLAFAILSDAIDGPLMRRIGCPSVAGAYFDATADCVVILSAFSAFAWIGIYPAWIVGLVSAVFLVFIVTSRLTAAIYDPVGRQIGGILFLSIAATLLLSDFFFQAVILSVVVGVLATTLIVRLVHTLNFARRGCLST